ncbi:hypothetical protein K449DRAFT_427183 [Hypoxylon sp. EC38]|nr:hypothetical protein K449DRAFT_427183 [Hypoxylon sp. EC38]
MATQATGFLDLPLELRQCIYQEVFRPYELQPEVGSSSWFIRLRMDVGILRVSRRISMEAYEVMLKSQPFVRIITWGLRLNPIFSRYKIPVFTIHESHIVQCKAPMMSYSIGIRDNTSVGHKRILMLAKDLGLVCKALALAESTIEGFGVRSMHVVTLHDPFHNTSTPNYMSVTRQERLLKPCQEHLRGFPSFRLLGKFDPSLSTTTAAAVRQPAFLNHTEFLQDLLRLNNLARMFHAAEDTELATAVLEEMRDKIRCVASRTLWPVMKAAQGPAFANTICDVLFMSSQSLVMVKTTIIKRLVDIAANPQLIKRKIDQAYKSVETAYTAGVILGTPWMISGQQKGEMSFRVAVMHRIAKDDPKAAKYYIRIAARSMPGNPHVTREQARIDLWRASLVPHSS